TLGSAGFFGGATADFGYMRGLTDRIDVGVAGGMSGAIGATAKVVVAQPSPDAWIALYGQARVYWINTDLRMAHGGAVATFGPVTLGGFVGNLWGRRDNAGGEPTGVSSRYFGGGVGFETSIEDMPTRVMLEVQRHLI